MDEENGPKLLPESDYNPVEAKFCACLFWLVFHATEDGDFENIPPEITCPTERDPEGIFQVRPLVAEFLCTGSVYKKVCSQFFDEERTVDSMWDIIQELSYDGFYAVDSNDEAVTEERLTDLESFDVDAHLALVDAIMSAYINHSVNIQHIVKAVSAFASFSAAKELPFDLEDALLLWLNKINSTNERRIHKSKSVEPNANESPRRFRFKKDQVLEKPSNGFPKLDDLQTDVANGKALLSLVYFYCPDVLSLESMKLSIPLKQSDAICNIELFRELCAQHICTSVFALRTEDFIYKAPELKNNVIALLSEMFIKLELEKESDINVNKLEKINLQNSHTETSHYNALGKDAKEDSGCQQKIRTDKVQKLGPEDYDGIRNDVNSTEPISSVKKASKFRDAENEDMSETNDIDSKDFYPLDNVETSIEDQLAKLKFLGSSSRGGIRKDVFDQAIDQTDKGKPPRSRQPLLSKRSRKQLATLGDEDRCLSADDLNGMQLVDFDLKRSHSMTSVVGKANFTVDPSKSVRAWEGARNSDDASKSKSQKISLDFKPDSSAYRRQTQTASSHGSTKEDFSDDVNRPSSQRIYTRTSTYAKEPDDVLSCPDAFNDMHEKVKDFPTRESSFGNRLESSFAEDFRTELLKHTDQMKSTEPVGDFVEPQLEEDDYLIGTNFAKPAIHQVDQLNKHASPRPNKLFGINQNNLGVHDEALSEMKGEDHDDDLSTIAETSEPSTPTVYSFDTRRSFGDSEDSHTIESDSSRISLSDSQTSPTIPSGDITPLYSVTDTELSLAGAASQETLSNGDNQGSVDLHHSSSEQLLQNSFSRGKNAKSYDGEHRLEASDVVPRASYTIMNSEMSLESAKAAGLPIIDAESKFTHNSIRTSLHSRDKDDYKDINGQLVQGNDNVNTVTSGQNFSGTPYEHSKTFSVRGPVEQKTEEMYVRHFEQADNSRTREAKNGLAGSFANEVGNIRESSSFDAMDPDTPRIESEVVTRSSKFNSDDIDLHVDSQKKLNIDKLSGFTQANKTELESTRSEKAEPVCEDHNFNDLKGSVGESTNNIAGESSHLFEDGQNEGEIIYANAIEGKDLNLTTTWSDVKSEKKGVTNRLLSPEDGKDPRISTVSNGPVTNWAQYAQSKATEDVVQSENEDDRGNESQRESLAPRLAVLKMQLEEKRRHIEEEKRKMMHQWNEERTKLGQQAFWLAVGKESNLEQERREQEKQAALDAEKKKKPGLIFFPFSDENDPAKALNNQKAKRNILESPPNECSTPLTPIPSQDPGNHTQPSTTSDYPVRENRIGSATIMEASTIGEQSAAFSLPKRTSYEALEAENQSGELQDQVFVSPRVQYQSKEQNAYTSDSRHHVAMPQSGKEPHQSSRLDDRGFEDASTNNTGRRTAWTDPYLVKPDDFPPYQKSVDERLDTRPGYSPRSEYINTDEVIRKNSYEEPDDITRQYVESQARAHYEPPPDIEGHAAAGSLRKESPRETAMFALQNEDAISEEGTPKEKGIAMVIPGDDISAAGPSCKTIIEITDDIESTQTTLTPEQQKKKEKFIQNRLKRQQEEKAKREAEQERKRRKEEKIKERKAQLEKKEIEEQERLRKQKQEEETLRGKLRDPEEVECAPFRIPRRDEQWGTPPGKKQGTPSGISRSPLLGQVEDNPPQQSSFAEYKGPPVYVKPTGKSNRQIIVNAISYCCLSGEVNKEAKEKSLQVLSQSNATHFFVLFRDGLKFRGLYTYVQEVDEAHKIYGVGPKVIVNKMIDRLFKYSSGAKSFTQIPAKSLSIQVDGIQINKECWSQGKGTKLPSKTDSNLRKGAATSSKSDLLKKGSPKPVRR